MLYNGTILNPVPLIITVVPTGPLVGVKEVMVGGCAKTAILHFLILKLKLPPLLATARSLFPSPSKSPIAIEIGLVPVAKSTFVANDEVEIVPLVEMFLNTETVLLL